MQCICLVGSPLLTLARARNYCFLSLVINSFIAACFFLDRKLLYTPNAIILHNQNRDMKGFSKRIYEFGYGRGSNRLWDLQVIPPIIGLFTIFISFISLKIFLLIILSYIIVILYFDIKIFMKTKNVRYIFSVPIVFILEHLSYTIGFWKGLLNGDRKKKNENLYFGGSK